MHGTNLLDRDFGNEQLGRGSPGGRTGRGGACRDRKVAAPLPIGHHARARMRRADVGEGSAAGERRARRRKPCCALARPPPVAAGGSTRPILMTIGRHPGLRQELVDRRQVRDQRDGSDHDTALMASALVTSAVEGGPAVDSLADSWDTTPTPEAGRLSAAADPAWDAVDTIYRQLPGLARRTTRRLIWGIKDDAGSSAHPARRSSGRS